MHNYRTDALDTSVVALLVSLAHVGGTSRVPSNNESPRDSSVPDHPRSTSKPNGVIVAAYINSCFHAVREALQRLVASSINEQLAPRLAFQSSVPNETRLAAFSACGKVVLLHFQ